MCTRAVTLYVFSVGDTKPWDARETSVLLDAYFAMLRLERAGTPYSKIEHNRLVQMLTGRSKGSIEFKFCNISHVLAEGGIPFIRGYKPRSHVQEALRAAVQEAAAKELKLLSGSEGAPPAPSSVVISTNTPVTSQLGTTGFKEEVHMVSSTPDKQDVGYWDALAGLWDRATGGTDVAARPDHPVDTSWPSALRPAGVEEACRWLRSGVAAGGPPRFLFLVGGPGAGKSHATSHVVEGMHLLSKLDEGLAHRIYEYNGELSDLVVVNDATINLSPDNRAPLISDVDRVVTSNRGRTGGSLPRHLMACVNRGVLVEEMAESRKRPSIDWGAGDVLIRWMYGSGSLLASETTWQVTDVTGNDAVKSAALTYAGEHIASIVAVFVDECSLFEERPAVEIGPNSKISAEDYRIAPLQQRLAMDAARTPAADLLANVLNVLDERGTDLREHATDRFADPIAANLESLRSPAVRSGLLTIARVAELTSSTRMTYRELWGFLTRALVGDAPSRMPREELSEYILAHQPRGLSSYDDFERLRALSALRMNQSIFGAGIKSAAPDGAMRDPVLKLLIPVDPVSDAVPGSNPDMPSEGWATPISDAFSVHASDGTPLQCLLGPAQNDTALHDVVTSFDRRLDEAFGDLLRSPQLKDDKRLEAIGWYGAYITRLYALAHGIGAFRREVDILIRTWTQSPHLPDELKSPLRTLIRPKRNPSESSSSILPLFDSRTEPITGRTATPKLAVRVKEPELSTDRKGQGEQVLLVIATDGTPISKVSLDFPMIREALACVDDHIGVTDLIDVTAPRLERVRASRLLASHLIGAEFCLAEGDEEVQVTQRYTKES